MASQRVGVGGSPIEPRLSNGPLRAQSKKVTSSTLADVGLTLTAGSMIVLRRAHGLCETEDGTRRIIPSLIDMFVIRQGLFL